jgi:hypothetical protein
VTVGRLILYPIPNSSGDSSGVPQRRQITAEQSPQVSGSVTSSAQFGQYRIVDSGWDRGDGGFGAMKMPNVAQLMWRGHFLRFR